MKMSKRVKVAIGSVSLIFVVGFIIFILWERQPYYKKYHYIAHALGGIDDIDYTNSKEALEYAYSKGTRIFEVDFVFTSDKKLVCRHKWKNDLGDEFSDDYIPDYETYMSSKIFGQYTPVDIDTLINFAKEHSEIYFVTDLKSYKTEMNDMLETIKEAATRLDYKDYEEHFIIQFYNYDMYNMISEKYSYQNYILTLYRMTEYLNEEGIENVLEFCISNDIKVITMPKKYVTKELCEKIKAKDITLYVHTINGKKEWLKLQLMGVDGIYTDFIYPYDIYRIYVIVGSIIFCGIVVIFISILYIRRRLSICKVEENKI